MITNILPLDMIDNSKLPTIKIINGVLSQRGHQAELIKGRGYFYFVGKDCENWYFTSVYVYKIRDLTVRQWIETFEAIKKENEQN